MSTTDAERTMTAYELQRALESIPTLVAKLPAILDRELTQTADDGIANITARISRVMDAVKTFEDLMAKKQTEVGDHYERLWKVVDAAHTRLADRINALEKLPQRISVPYNFKDLLDLAERCGNVSEADWARVIEISRVLSTMGGTP